MGPPRFSNLSQVIKESIAPHFLMHSKGIRIYTVKGGWQLDDTIQSKVMAMVFAMASEIERDLISKRTRHALLMKKEAGVRLGRPKGAGKSKLDVYRIEIEALLNNGSTQQFIAKRYGTTKQNLANWLRKNSINRRTDVPI